MMIAAAAPAPATDAHGYPRRSTPRGRHKQAMTEANET
jgi:hypothetical protein